MTLDTNIIIAYMKDESPVASFLDEAKKQGPLFLPATVEGEFLSFAAWTPEQRVGMEKFLEESFLFVPLDRPITRLAAHIRTKVKIKFADASIAATVIFTNTPLATRNTRDFKNIPGPRARGFLILRLVYSGILACPSVASVGTRSEGGRISE